MSRPKYKNSDRMIGRTVIVSNRLPIVIEEGNGEGWHIKPGQGGLVTALAPALRDRGGLWIGWPGTSEDVDFAELLAMGSKDAGYLLKPVVLTAEEINQYYFGFSNEILWPLFHDLQSRCNFDPAYWNMYQAVNRKFAQVVAENTGADDYIWVHDYHLMLVARALLSGSGYYITKIETVGRLGSLWPFCVFPSFCAEGFVFQATPINIS